MGLSFNNSTSTYVQHYLGATYDVPLTIALWANPGQTNANDALASLNVGTIAEALGTALSLRINSSAQVLARSSTESANSLATTTSTYSANSWQHFAARYASATSRIAYYNGSPSSTETTSRLTPGLEYLIIGRGSGGTQDPASAYNGSIAEVAVWNVALDAAEIAALAKGFRASLIRPDNLIAYLPIIRDVYDVVSSQAPTNTGTSVSVHPARIA